MRTAAVTVIAATATILATLTGFEVVDANVANVRIEVTR